MNFKNKFYVDTNGGQELTDATAATWAAVSAGISSATPAASETTDTTAYFDGNGQSETDVTGKATTIAFSGHRKHGDEAQDYIASKFFASGDELRTLGKWVDAGGNEYVFVTTLTAIVPMGGNANAKETFSFTMTINGEPQITLAEDVETPAP